jgi:para-aminobenzoate synthetase component 1
MHAHVNFARSYSILSSLLHAKQLNLRPKQLLMRTDATTLRSLMNDFGSRRQPFVFAVDYDMSQCLFIDNPLCSNEIRWATESAGNAPLPRPCDNITPVLRLKNAPTLREYAAKFETVKCGLMHGDSFLANLTVGVEVECNRTFEQLYALCSARYKFLIPGEFVCFSPERFVRIDNNIIATYPMKGTIDATLPRAESQLMDSYKERCEHSTIVDLLRNDLSMVAQDVHVSRYRYIDRIRTQRGEILQTSSEIVGRLSPDWHDSLGNTLFRLLPAGSICGAPKAATVSLIARAEAEPRGWYTGVWGYYDGRTLDTAVMIRCLAHRDGHTYFHSGGGITVNSQPDDEYNEVLQKIYLPIG